MFKLEEEMKSIDREQMGKISKALLAIFDFVSVMIEFFGLDLRLEPNRKELKEEIIFNMKRYILQSLFFIVSNTKNPEVLK